MSDMSINQVLAQMRAIQADIGVDAATTNVSETKPGGVDFSQILSDSINKVAETQNHAAAMSKAFQAGDNTVELPEVMIALQKSSISFEAMTQVRNKLLSAYQEIMRMPV